MPLDTHTGKPHGVAKKPEVKHYYCYQKRYTAASALGQKVALLAFACTLTTAEADAYRGLTAWQAATALP